MKIGMRKPSIKRMIGAQKAKITRKRNSVLPLYGVGIYTNPKKKVYNYVYKRTTFSIIDWIKKAFK